MTYLILGIVAYLAVGYRLGRMSIRDSKAEQSFGYALLFLWPIILIALLVVIMFTDFFDWIEEKLRRFSKWFWRIK